MGADSTVSKRSRPKKRTRMHSLDEVIEALKKAKGFQAQAADILGVTRSAITHRIKNNPELKDVIAQAKERNLDRAEDKLDEMIKSGNTAALIFYLKTQGQSRGYIEKYQVLQEVKDINMNIRYVDK